MPRATRYLQEGFIYHLTHRCHDAQFFLRFSKERNVYREWLRIGVQRYGVPVLGYNVTSNHVHVVAEVQDRYAVADISMEKYEIPGPGADGAWVIQESAEPYGPASGEKSHS